MAIFDATYISANSFSVPTDVRNYFLSNIAVTVECGGVWVFSYVESSSFGGGITTVTLKTSVLYAPCGNAELGIHPYMTPFHSHDDSTNSGGMGVVGAPPSHQWNGTQIRFIDSYGVWGSWVDLKGASIEYRGTWSGSSIDYVVLNVVINGGSSYLCTVAHTSGSSTQPGVGGSWQTVWALLATKGDQGIQGIQGIQGDPGETGINWLTGSWQTPYSYYQRDALSYNGNSYICIANHTSYGPTEPGIGGDWQSVWEIIASKGAAGVDGSFYEYKEAWTSGHSYVTFDMVTNDGSSYGCLVGHSADATTEPGTGVYWESYWFLMAEKGDLGPQGDAGIIGNWLGPWTGSSHNYVIHDCVFNDGSSYTCISGHTSDTTNEPGTGVYWATYWQLVAEKGSAGDPGIDWIGVWSGSSVPYDLYDAVSNDGSSYICILGHTSDASTEPGTGVYWATYWDTLAEAGVGGGGGGVVASTWASRPAAGTEGRLHLPTDNVGFTAYDTGAAWVVHHPLEFACSNPPAYNTFTQVGGGAETTLVADGDGLLFTQMGTNSSARTNVGLMVALPGGGSNYTFCVGFNFTRFNMAPGTYMGLCLSNGTNAASSYFINYTPYSNSATVVYDLCQTWHPINTYSGVYVNTYHVFFPLWSNILFMRIRDDNTNRYFEYSQDGRFWVLCHQVSRTDFTTPTYCGLFAAQVTTAVVTTTVRSQAKIFHWTLG
jgi:hypothetical protein